MQRTRVSQNGIDLVILEYLGFSKRRIKTRYENLSCMHNDYWHFSMYHVLTDDRKVST